MTPASRTEGPSSPGAAPPPLRAVPADPCETLQAIAAAVLEPPRGTHPIPSIASGVAGEALFLYHWGRRARDDAALRRATDCVEFCAAALSAFTLSPYLYAGLAGVAWLFAHLQRLGAAGVDFDLDDIDELLTEHLDAFPGRPHFDLIGGLAGLAVYFLERLPSPAAAEGLRRLVARLGEIAETTATGIVWHTSPLAIRSDLREQFPSGRYDLGVAHGTPGVIACLALVARHGGAARAGALPLLEGAARWMNSARRPPQSASAYPYMLVPGKPDTGARTRCAWCYGDPGVAAALLLAGSALDDAALRGAAIEMGVEAARRATPQEAEVVDASLCHGASGLAHVYAMMAEESGLPAFRATARHWVRETLRLRRPGRGVGGYEYYAGSRGSSDGAWAAERGFLTGSAGIGLALMHALDPVDRSWDRLLLLS